MKRITTGLLAVATALTGATGVLAGETVQTAGQVCWTGEMERYGTSEQNFAWAWRAEWTFTSKDGDLSAAQSGHCTGSGAMVAGAIKVNPEYCLHTRTDGVKFMSQGMSGPQGSKSTMFGGTGAFEGVTGGWTGGARLDLPAGEGRLAGCRETTGEYTLAN